MEETGCRRVCFRPDDQNHPEWYGQTVECVTSAALDDIAAEIAARISDAIANPGVAAAVVLLPGVTTLDAAASVFLLLDGQPGWNVTTSKLQTPPAGDMVAIHITRTIPFGNATCPSEALVLGPFEEFPSTRRAPVTTLEIYVGEPRPTDPKDPAKATTKVNLAHIEMNLPTHMAFEKIWNMSVDGRARSLGGPDNRAKAKVSFVIPTALAQQLGCAP